MIDPMSISLPEFLSGWLGPPDAPLRPVPDSHSWIPEPLREWYELSSRWTREIMSIKEMRKPEEITQIDHKAVFMSDPGQAIWAFDHEHPTRVYEGTLYGDLAEVPEEFPEFLIHNVLNEAAYSAPSRRSCSEIEEGQLGEITGPMTEVNFGGWRWPRPGHRIFVSDSLIADVGPAIERVAPWRNKPGQVEVHIGGKEPAALSFLDDIPGINWQRSGPR